MKKEIIDRITLLGGKSNFQKQALKENLETIVFNKTFLLKGFEDLLADEIYTKINVEEVLSEDEITYPRIEFIKKIFTPFEYGSDDYTEWEGHLNEEAIREVIKTEKLEFMYIGQTDSWPNYYFVSLSDSDTENPTVYTTDHEVFFDEIEVFGNLEEFFNMFVSEEKYLDTISDVIKELCSE